MTVRPMPCTAFRFRSVRSGAKYPAAPESAKKFQQMSSSPHNGALTNS